MTGELFILNVGEGDTKLTFDKSKPAERERAGKVVEDLLKRGFAILIEVGEKDGEPLYQRAHGFDPETSEYIIVGAPEPAVEPPAEPRQRGGGRKRTKRLAADTTNAVAVARSAGG